MAKGRGGNAHQRAIARATHPKPTMVSPSFPMSQNPKANRSRTVKAQPMRVAEALGLVITVLGLGLMFLNFWSGILVLDIFGLMLAALLICARGLIRAFLLLLVPALAFINWYLFRPAEPHVFVDILPYDRYSPDTAPSGAPWRPDVTYVNVSIINDTEFDFADVDLILTFDDGLSIVSLDQLSNVAGVAFHGDATKEVVTFKGVKTDQPSMTAKAPDGHLYDIPLKQLGTPQYRVTCPKLFNNSSRDMIVAVAKFDLTKSSDHERVMHITRFDDQGAEEGTLWFGPIADAPTQFVYDRVNPAYMLLTGSYVAHFKPVHLNIKSAAIMRQP
jgi:hypothetical protein